MSEFGGLRKHDKTQYALSVGLDSAALAAAVSSLTQVRRPEFPKGIIKYCVVLYCIDRRIDLKSFQIKSKAPQG